MNKAIFLDRDGVLNADLGYVNTKSRTIFLEENITYFASIEDFIPIIVTNQSGIGRGFYTEKEFLSYMDWFTNELAARGLIVANFYYCPHLPSDGCNCRKPNPGLLHCAQKDNSLDMSKCVLYGDKDTDVEAGFRAGVKDCYLI